MSEATPARPADRNLLFGILALQMNFIDCDALVAAMHAWVLAKHKPLGQILREQDKLNPEYLQLLDAMVAAHLQAHRNDPAQSLAALSSLSPVRDDLQALSDPDVQASLARTGSTPTDADATGPFVLRTADGTAAVQRYRILRPHARGGLGEVFVAEDQELHREVALKEIQQQHAQSKGRFVLEAEITGGLEHPGIVPVYGLGQYGDGRPFYAMRFIKGDNLKEAIKRFHDRPPSAGRESPQTASARNLEYRQLLRRFIDVCNAIAYAHSRGVLHRDLKPGNIMLGKFGETLIIDWGLAKAAGRAEAGKGSEEASLRLSSGSGQAATVMGTALGTPAYMSPEQAAGRLDLLGPASDVYSLGATLYAVLTGRAPFRDEEAIELLQKVQRGEFAAPRSVNSAVPPALEAICLKAMARAPEDRYPSPRELASEIDHWLADEPVSAYPEPLGARLARWGRRHRSWVAASAALLVTAVMALSVGLVVVQGERRITQTALEAEAQRRQQARAALDALSSQIVEDWLAQSKAKDLTAQQKKFLQQALDSYEEFARDTGQEESSREGVAAAHLRVGDIRRKLGQMNDADTAYRRAIELYTALTVDFPTVAGYRRDLARSHRGRGTLLEDTGRLKEAEAAYRGALALEEQLAADFPTVPDYRQELARSYDHLGSLLQTAGQPREAEAAFRDALALRKQLATDFPSMPDYRQDLAASHCSIGRILYTVGRLQEAEAAFCDALAIQQQLAADLPTVPAYRVDLAHSRKNLGVLLYTMGRLQEAEAAYRDALARWKQLAADFPNVPLYRQNEGKSHYNLGMLLAGADRSQAAEAAFRDAQAIQKQLVADFPSVPDYRQELASIDNNLGQLLVQVGRLPEAETAFRDALALKKQLVADSPTVPDYQNLLAGTLLHLGQLFHERKDYAAARQMYEEALPHHQAALQANPGHPYYRRSFRDNRQGLTETLLTQGEHSAAAETSSQLLEAAVDPAGDAYKAACFLARCVPLAEHDKQLADPARKERAQHYADQTMAALRRAVQNGYKDMPHMKQDPDLAAIRSRPDFQKLVVELEKK
jgi:serine/threonine-protein kinase